MKYKTTIRKQNNKQKHKERKRWDETKKKKHTKHVYR
jgi:hypothetical protein